MSQRIGRQESADGGFSGREPRSPADDARHTSTLPIELSVLIPCFNEELRLAPTTERLVEAVRALGLTAEIIVANDGSTDATGAVIRSLERRYPEVRGVHLANNRGKGAALQAAYLASSGRRILFMDADGATDLEAIPRFLHALEDADVVVGSRRHPASILPTPQPSHRRWLGNGFHLLVRLVTGISIADTQCGFKMFTRAAADLLFPRLRVERFATDVEMLYLASRAHLRLAECPVTWTDQHGSRVRIPQDPLNMLVDVLGVRLGDRLGRYR